MRDPVALMDGTHDCELVLVVQLVVHLVNEQVRVACLNAARRRNRTATSQRRTFHRVGLRLGHFGTALPPSQARRSRRVSVLHRARSGTHACEPN